MKPRLCEPCCNRKIPNLGVLQCAYCNRWFCFTHLADKAHDCFTKFSKQVLKG